MPKLPNAAHREQIVDAAARLFVQRGFAGTSIQDIADALGVTRTAVYYYFRNKEEILRSLVEEISVAASARLHAREVAGTHAERLRSLVRDYAALILEHPLHFRVVERAEADLPEDLAKVHRRAKRQVLESLTQAVRNGSDAGEFRAVDARLAAFAILGMCNWTSAWHTPQGRLSAVDVADGLADLAVAALRVASRKDGRPLSRAALLDRAIVDLQALRGAIDEENSGD